MYPSLVKPLPLKFGDTIGIFTPSWPAHVILRDKYLHALNELQRIGFNYLEGNITAKQISQGYRSASPQERAREFMDLISNPQVHCLMATIGGSNSASMIPFLDFDKIRKSRKLICGYSDVTSLHLSILKYSRLSTIYGVALVPSFGEYPSIAKESLNSFLMITSALEIKKFKLEPPIKWSNQFIDAKNSNWKSVKRCHFINDGWKSVYPGEITASIIVANLETLVSSAGTSYFPDVNEKILVLEETSAIYNKTERNFRQLESIGVFNQIKGLILCKPGEENNEEAPFAHEQLILEIIGPRSYPIISNFDCGHTFPMISLPEEIKITINSNKEKAEIFLEESAVAL